MKDIKILNWIMSIVFLVMLFVVLISYRPVIAREPNINQGYVTASSATATLMIGINTKRLSFLFIDEDNSYDAWVGTYSFSWAVRESNTPLRKKDGAFGESGYNCLKSSYYVLAETCTPKIYYRETW